MDEAVLTRPKSLAELQKMFLVIYDDHNRERYSDADLLLHVFEDISESLESIRKEHLQEVVKNLPRTFAWFMAFCNRMEIDLSKVVWHKYPNLCPYCLKSAHCACISHELKYRPTDSDLTQYRRDMTYMPVTLSDWQTMFDHIYGRINRNVASFTAVYYHLVEELGEVSKDFRFKNRSGIEAEVADFFAWILAVSIKLGVDLDSAAWACYPGECNKCRKSKCECPVE